MNESELLFFMLHMRQIRNFIKFGPYTCFKAFVDKSKEAECVRQEKNSKGKSKLFKIEYSELYLENWNRIHTFKDYNLYVAIRTFFQWLEEMDRNGTKTTIYNISTGQKTTNPDVVSEIVSDAFCNVFTYIAKKSGIESPAMNNVEERTIKQIDELLKKLWPCCENNYYKRDWDDEAKNISNLLDYMRIVRNLKIHKNLYLPSVCAENALFYIYGYITLIYYLINKGVIKIDEKQYDNYDISIEIKNVKGQVWEISPKAQQDGNEVRLRPFNEYTLISKLGTREDKTTFIPDFSYERATVELPDKFDRIDSFKLRLLSSQYQETEKGLKAIEDKIKSIEDEIKKGLKKENGTQDISTTISDSKYEEIKSLLNMRAAAMNKEEYAKIVSDAVESCMSEYKSNTIPEDKITELRGIIDEGISKTEAWKEEVKKWQNKVSGDLEKIQQGINEGAVTGNDTNKTVHGIKRLLWTAGIIMKKRQEEVKKWGSKVSHDLKTIKRLLWTVVIIILVVALFVGGSCYYRFGYNSPENAFRRGDYVTAYEKGHPDAAYEYAKFLEKKGMQQEINLTKYVESQDTLRLAAEWYRKAIKRYEELVEEDSISNTRAAYRLAQMIIRMKGGYMPDYKKAIRYANIAAPDYGSGLLIYSLYASQDDENGDQRLFLDEIDEEQLQGADDYILLVKSLNALSTPNTDKSINTKERCDSARNTLKDLFLKGEKSDASCEIVFWNALGLLNGVDGGDGKIHYAYGPAILQLTQLANENYLPAILELSDIYRRVGLSEAAILLQMQAFRNGVDEVTAQLYPSLKESDLKKEVRKALLRSRGARNIMVRICDTYNLLNSNDVEKKKTGIKDWHKLYKEIQESYPNIYMAGIDDIITIELQVNGTSQFLDSLDTETKNAALDYLQGICFAKGYYYNKIDTVKSDSLIKESAQKGYLDAKYTYARRLDMMGEKEKAAEMLFSIADSDYRAIDWLAYMSEHDKTLRYSIESRLNKYGKAYSILSVAKSYDLWKWDHTPFYEQDSATLAIMTDKLERAVLENGFKNRPLCGYLMGETAILFASAKLDRELIAQYVYAAEALNPNEYHYRVELAEVFLKNGFKQDAVDCYADFCIKYIRENNINAYTVNARDKKLLESIVYPGLIYMPEVEKIILDSTYVDMSKYYPKEEREAHKSYIHDGFEYSLGRSYHKPDEPVYKY